MSNPVEEIRACQIPDHEHHNARYARPVAFTVPSGWYWVCYIPTLAKIRRDNRTVRAIGTDRWFGVCGERDDVSGKLTVQVVHLSDGPEPHCPSDDPDAMYDGRECYHLQAPTAAEYAEALTRAVARWLIEGSFPPDPHEHPDIDPGYARKQLENEFARYAGELNRGASANG